MSVTVNFDWADEAPVRVITLWSEITEVTATGRADLVRVAMADGSRALVDLATGHIAPLGVTTQ